MVIKNQFLRNFYEMEQVLKNSFFQAPDFYEFWHKKPKTIIKENARWLSRRPTAQKAGAEGGRPVLVNTKQELRTFLNSTNQSTIRQYFGFDQSKQGKRLIKAWIWWTWRAWHQLQLHDKKNSRWKLNNDFKKTKKTNQK